MAKWVESMNCYAIKVDVHLYNGSGQKVRTLATDQIFYLPVYNSDMQQQISDPTIISQALATHVPSFHSANPYYFAPDSPSRPYDYTQFFNNISDTIERVDGYYISLRDNVAGMTVNIVPTGIFAYGAGYSGQVTNQIIMPVSYVAPQDANHPPYIRWWCPPAPDATVRAHGVLVLHKWTSDDTSYVCSVYNAGYLDEFLAAFNSEFDTPDDPYSEGGSSDTGGGEGDFDNTGDDIDIPSLPTLSAVDTGLITLFNPSVGELKNLANYLWSSGFDLETFKKMFANPMDCILGLSIVPVNVPAGSSEAISVGNISTGVYMTKASRQYVEVDCGSLNVNEYWGAYLDYEPFTKAEIYLPYIGTHALAVDDIMGKSVHVVYHVDILSGACTAFVKCGDSVLYEFIGQCSSSIPVTGNDWTNVINGVLSIAGAIGSMVATGGASAPLAAGAIASTAVNSMKPTVEKSGSMSGTGGMLGVQTPYIILTRPNQALPADQNKFSGYPSFITENLGSLTGYTEVDSVHLENVHATNDELQEIVNLLHSGVIF